MAASRLKAVRRFRYWCCARRTRSHHGQKSQRPESMTAVALSVGNNPRPIQKFRLEGCGGYPRDSAAQQWRSLSSLCLMGERCKLRGAAEIVLCMLIVVFRFDPIAGQSSVVGKCKIVLVALFCVLRATSCPLKAVICRSFRSPIARLCFVHKVCVKPSRWLLLRVVERER